MSQFKLVLAVVCLSLLAGQSAFAQPGWRHPHRYYYGYAPPVYAYPPVVVPRPPIVVGPPAYIPPPVYGPPVYAPPVYAPAPYGYGVVGPRGHLGFGYSTPGFGVYLGR